MFMEQNSNKWLRLDLVEITPNFKMILILGNK